MQLQSLLARAELVIASDLTLIECDRVLIRAVALGELDESSMADRPARLNEAAARWQGLRLGPEIVERARQSFPTEPIRALDAIHLASALDYGSWIMANTVDGRRCLWPEGASAL